MRQRIRTPSSMRTRLSLARLENRVRGGKAVAKITGKLASISTRCLMAIIYLARLGRQDLLRAIDALTAMITKWDELGDCKLFRFIRYINGSTKWRHIGFVGDKPSELRFVFSQMPMLLGID